MKKNILKVFFFLLFISCYQTAFCQGNNLNWDNINKESNISKKEVNWLLDSVSNDERAYVINIVSSLSKPGAAQMISSYFFLDGSYKRDEIKPYIDSFYVRPPDSIAGLIRVAYLSAYLRKRILEKQETNKVYVNKFNGNTFNLPKKSLPGSNSKMKLSFDFEPANTIIEILSTPDITSDEILKRLDTHFFKLLFEHHSQSFYTVPLSSEQMALCLERAASNKPIDLLYRYINPYGLLNYNDVKNNLPAYKSLLDTLASNKQAILDYIITSISSLLPDTTRFSRRVSFVMISGADGWANQDVAAVDINYFKDNYTKILNLLVHETYHSAQDAVHLNANIKKSKNEQWLADVLNNIFLEGTATYIAPPKLLTPAEYSTAVNRGAGLIEEIYTSTIVKYDEENAQSLFDQGIGGGGPFYYMGAEMSKTIVAELGEKKLAGIIPYDGLRFFKIYFEAIDHSKKYRNKFSPQFERYIKSMN